MAHVAIMEGEDRRKRVRKAVDDLGHPFWKACKDAEYIFLKVNLHELDVHGLMGVMDAVRLYSAVPIVLGDAPPLGARVRFREDDLMSVMKAYRDIHLLDLTEDSLVESFFARDEGGELLFRRSRSAIMAPFSITLGSPRDWALGTWIVPPRETQYGRSWSRDPWLQALSPAEEERLVAEFFHAYPCHAAVQSGILQGRMAAASMDPVALETVCEVIRGGDAHQIPHLEMLGATGKWTNEISEIDLPLSFFQEHLSL